MYSIITVINGEKITIGNIKEDNIVNGSYIIVQSKLGLEYVKVEKVLETSRKEKSPYTFLRIATKEDEEKYKKNNIESQKAFIKCRELIKKYKLPMKLVSSNYTFDKDQLIFKFLSDDRVDFRKLAKDLANIYKTRIELRQIGVRDQAKEIGVCGQCGRELCCKGILKEFNSVSINMAKNQNIALNPTKINGSCGRLLCCLKYEDDFYKECRKDMPKIGKEIKTVKGVGKVHSINPIKKTFSIITEEKNIIECDLDDCIK